MKYDELSALDEGEYSVGVGNGVDVPHTVKGEVKEVSDLPQAVFVALFRKIDPAAAFHKSDFRLYEIRHYHIVLSVKLYLATGDASIVIEMELKRLVGIPPDERHSVNAFQLKFGKFTV